MENIDCVMLIVNIEYGRKMRDVADIVRNVYCEICKFAY